MIPITPIAIAFKPKETILQFIKRALDAVYNNSSPVILKSTQEGVEDFIFNQDDTMETLKPKMKMLNVIHKLHALRAVTPSK